MTKNTASEISTGSVAFSFKLVVVGGGAGGCSTAAKFASKLGKGNVAVIEPRSVSDISYSYALCSMP
jgi:2-polyprenyl-6-methoxyphenol hydroxylase-like FAD-dependent oxidoreductase